MTMMIKNWPPKMSNEVLNNMFSGGLSGFFKDGNLTYGSLEGNRHLVMVNEAKSKTEYPVY